MNNQGSKRIAINTMMLYIRMLLIMLIGLYTSRVVLEQLGENDLGIYNVVGGIVTMFSILSSSLSSAISRFLSFELGRENKERLRKIFSTSVIIQLGLGFAVAILTESGGVWFLNHRMNIAPERMFAANCVLQCSVVTFIINMLSIPYNAAIISHEKMAAFAYIGMIEVALKLAVALMLFIPIFDSLITYAVLLVVAAAIVRLTYGIYCKRHFEECRFEFGFDRAVFKEMIGFSSWNFIGSTAAILKDQGVNIVMNIFCGTTVNAARALALQVNNSVHGFANNFMLAVNPRIIKSYASGDTSYMFELGFRSARLAFYLLLCISLPLITVMPFVLDLWLTQVPVYTVSFTRLVLVLGMAEIISIPLQFMNFASGKLKTYQLTVGGIQMLNFPIAYLLLSCGMSPNSVFVLSIVLSQLCLAARLWILHNNIGLSIKKYFIDVYLRIAVVATVSGILAYIVYQMSRAYGINSILECAAVLIITVFISFCIGCRKDERQFLLGKLQAILKRKRSGYA